MATDTKLRAPKFRTVAEWKSILLKRLKEALGHPDAQECEFETLDEIAKIYKEIDLLEQSIEKEYRGPCFDHTYKMLIEKCCQIQQKLDDTNVAGKPTEKQRKRNGIIRAEQAAKNLNSKTHPNGKPCHKCK